MITDIGAIEVDPEPKAVLTRVELKSSISW